MFTEQIQVQLLSDAQFEHMVLSDFENEAFITALNGQKQLLEALEMIPANTDYVALVQASMGEGIIGLYVPSTTELFVRGTEVTPFVAATVVHELTHAIDDQHFDLDSIEVQAGDADLAFALSALAEGSATTVESDYVDSLPAEQVVLLRQEQADFASQMRLPISPPSVTEISQDAYSLGETFVARLIHGGGMAALDAAFRDPPMSTEQVLHPDRFASRDSVTYVLTPPYEGTEITNGTIGEQTLIELLSADLDPATARAAAQGWGGDHYVLYSTGSETCARMDFALDSNDDTLELLVAFTKWGAHQHEVTITQIERQRLRVTTCGPST